ncbi:MAG TPA: hypothetical protein VEK57_26705 [Thermoanaerobaculia bacterium]|nr:hypothetical protein [Thermoanaerobaculia bacterium]
MNRPAPSKFPPAELLVRFFQADPAQPVPLADAAALLGMSAFELRGLLRAEGGHERGNRVRWSEVAAYLFDSWPRRPLLQAIERAAGPVLPPKFRLMRVDWWLPLFLVQAMRYQAAHDPAAGSRLPRRLSGRLAEPSVDDYVSDLLFAHIAPATLEHFRSDEKFMRAYLYPVLD